MGHQLILSVIPFMSLRFGDLSFDAAARRVTRDGRELKLTRKAFDLLAMLVERRPDAVAKDDIHARLWPDTYVAEITLHSLVSELRRAIGDDTNDPHFIRTVHGFGYAFIADSQPQPIADHRRVRGWLIWDHERLQVFDGENVFGRGDADVVELPSTTVSRRHARISFDDDPWIEDLGSKNGTFVGDNRVTSRVRLNDGDRVRFGSFLLTFRVARPSDATATQSASDIPSVSK
jgi:DNA-binding winged helix-turn-helix (wHTH) protein